MWDGRRLTPTRAPERRRISITPSWPRALCHQKALCVTRASHEGGEEAVEGFGEANAPISWKQAPNLCVSGSPKSVLLHLPWVSVCRGVLAPEFEVRLRHRGRYSWFEGLLCAGLPRKKVSGL